MWRFYSLLLIQFDYIGNFCGDGEDNKKHPTMIIMSTNSSSFVINRLFHLLCYGFPLPFNALHCELRHCDAIKTWSNFQFNYNNTKHYVSQVDAACKPIPFRLLLTFAEAWWILEKTYQKHGWNLLKRQNFSAVCFLFPSSNCDVRKENSSEENCMNSHYLIVCLHKSL